LDRAKAQYYEEITLRYLIIQTAEIKGSFFTNEIAGYYIKDKSVKPFVPIKALEYIHDLEQYTIEIPTQKVIYNKRLLEVLYYMTKYNYHKTIEVCESAILFFENQNFLNRASVRVFYMQAAVAYTYCRDFKEGYNKANRCLELVDEGHYNWFKTQELRLQLAIYAKQYQEAYTILRTVMKHGRFEKLPKPTAQWWVLNEGFLFVLKKIGLFVPEEGDMMHLRFHSFINKVQIWSNDKRGMNFSLHVLYLFYLITRKDGKYLDKYLDKLESLKQYVRRYANEDGMQRSKWMITILEKIGDSGFVPKTYLKDATIMQSINNLIHEPYDITDTNIEIEPVPFQDVYHYINQVLTNKMTVEDYEIAV
jgi:hypothetical protein